MPTYTDVEKHRREFWPVQDDEVMRRIQRRAALLAYNYINSVLTGIFPVPFAPTPPEIEDISDLLTKAIGLQLQLKQGPVMLKRGKNAPMEVDLALGWLERLVSGDAELVGIPRLKTKSGVHNLDGYMHIFDLDDSSSHHPDPDYIEDVQRKRNEI